VLLSILAAGSGKRRQDSALGVSGGFPMPSLTIEYRDENERLALEQAIAYVADLRQLALDAPTGTVLDACERLALDQGRALLRSTLAASLQARISTAEQKGGMPASVLLRTPDAPRGSTTEPS
jgi:hypothetical protein